MSSSACLWAKASRHRRGERWSFRGREMARELELPDAAVAATITARGPARSGIPCGNGSGEVHPGDPEENRANYCEAGSSMAANAHTPPRVPATTAPEPRLAAARATTFAPSVSQVSTSRSNKRVASTAPAATPPGTTKRSRTNTFQAGATTLAKKKSTNTSSPTKNTRSSKTSPAKNTRYASAQRDGSMRRTFIAPRQSTSTIVQAGLKRIRKPSERLKDYFYASGN
ncbi:hypothetical protein ZWY2020_039779 [Hordeum vulgare]|nr:hypothetical protein ZWY2020_039779 [Hordeum vulgare]